MLDLAWHVRFRFQLRPQQATGDTTYGTLENISALEREGIRAYVPLPDWEHQRDYYGPQQFTYDADRDVYVSPGATAPALPDGVHRRESGVPCRSRRM
jgi:hypothetical protein